MGSSSFSDGLFAAAAIGTMGALFVFAPLWGPPLLFYRRRRHRHLAEFPFRANPRATGAYSTMDSLVLVFFLSIGNAFASLSRYSLNLDWQLWMFASTNILIIAIWIRGLRFMKSNGIITSRDRIVFQAVLNPIGVIGPAAVVCNIGWAGIVLWSSFEEWVFDERALSINVAPILGGALLVGLAAAISYAARLSYLKICSTAFDGSVTSTR